MNSLAAARSLTLLFVSFVCFVCLPSLPAAARAAPRDELLRLVPDDVAFCLVVQDLRGHARDLAASPFAEAFRKSPFGAALKDSGEFKKLAQLDAELRKQVGLDAAGIADRLLGDAFVLAYRPSPAGKADQDQGLFLLRAHDADTLADFVERLNRAQKESGDLKRSRSAATPAPATSAAPSARAKTSTTSTGRCWPSRRRRRCSARPIERDRDKGHAEPAVARQLRLLGAERALAGLWINPRAFDAEMARNLEQAKGTDAVVQRAFLR